MNFIQALVNPDTLSIFQSYASSVIQCDDEKILKNIKKKEHVVYML